MLSAYTQFWLVITFIFIAFMWAMAGVAITLQYMDTPRWGMRAFKRECTWFVAMCSAITVLLPLFMALVTGVQL